MIQELTNAVRMVAQLSALIEEYDMIMAAHYALHYKGEILSKYASSHNEDNQELKDEIQERLEENESMLAGAELEISSLTRTGVEQSRMMIMEIRTLMSEIVARKQREIAEAAQNLDDEDLLDWLRDLASAEEG